MRNRDGSYGTVTAITRASARRVVYNLTVAEAATFFVGDDGWLVHHAGTCYPLDFSTQRTKNWSAYYNSEAEARAIARMKLGTDPVQEEGDERFFVSSYHDAKYSKR